MGKHTSRHTSAVSMQGGKRHIVRWVLLGILVLIIAIAAAGGVLGTKFYREAMQVKAHEEAAISSVGNISDLQNLDQLDSLSGKISDIQKETSAAKTIAHGSLWNIAAHLPYVGGDIQAVQTMTDVVDSLTSEAMPQLIDTMTSLKDANLSKGDGQLNLEPIVTTADALSKVNDGIQKQTETLASMSEPKIGIIRNAYDKANDSMQSLSSAIDQLTGMINMLPDFLGMNGARNYVLIAQTNSEVRASGGLAGSVGSVTADNGTISVGEFHADSQFSKGVAAGSVTSVEQTLYSGLGYGSYIHNVTSNPNFPDVADLAAQFWKAQSFGSDQVDGVMSLDPVALQALIGATGEVTMPDGRVLDGTNTAEFLLNKVYSDVEDPAQQDVYFAATAEQTVDHLFSDMNVTKLMKVAQAMLSMGEQRHVYVWSFHEEDQPKLRQAGLTGEINTDAKNPATGIYFQQMYASKMDWYIKRTSKVTRTACNDDGTATYHVTYTVQNTLDSATAASLPHYITSVGAGSASERVQIYAPAGGSVSNVTASTGDAFQELSYESHQVWMTDGIVLAPGASTVIEYDVTTAAGAADLKLDQTPVNGTDPGITYDTSACVLKQ